MPLILTIAAVFVLLLVSELWWRKRRPHDEFSRKFIHITVGTFVAFWPYILSWTQIRFLGAAFVLVVVISKYLNIFSAIHAVERPTYGEVCFAVAVGALTFITQDRLIYLIALLHMGVADGMAAIVGTVYGKKNSYRILGHTKSLAGSATFLGCSLVLLTAYATVQPHALPAIVIVGLAFLSTGLENVAVFGFDNLVVPVVLTTALSIIR